MQPNPAEFKGCTFVLRISTADREIHPGNFMVANNLAHALIAGTVMNKALKAGAFSEYDTDMRHYTTALIEVWEPNSPYPKAILAHGGDIADGQACSDCELREECSSGHGACSKPENGREKTQPTQPTGKPEGLTKDVSLADMLLEAYEAMNPDTDQKKNESENSPNKE